MHFFALTTMLLVADLPNAKWCKKPKKWLKPWQMGLLIWEHSVRAIYWIKTWQGLYGFQKSLHLCAFDVTSLSIWRVKTAQQFYRSDPLRGKFLVITFDPFSSYPKFSSASKILSTITLKLNIILQNIWRRVFGSDLMNISPSNIFPSMLLLKMLHQN